MFDRSAWGGGTIIDIRNNYINMEKFDHKDFRDDLARDLKKVEDHDERKEALEHEKKGFRYEPAKKEHLKDAEFFRSILDSSEMKAEEMSKKLFRDFFGEKYAELAESGPCYCALAHDIKIEELGGESLNDKTEEEKIKAEKYIRHNVLINEFRNSFRKDGIKDEDINTEIKKDSFLCLDQSIHL